MWDKKRCEGLRAELEALSDEEYCKFHSRIVPGIGWLYGVRMPKLKLIAKEILREDPEGFLSVCRGTSYEEDMLRGLVLGGLRDADAYERHLREFLPSVSNWAVCDGTAAASKIVGRNLEHFYPMIEELLSATEIYTVRLGYVLLLDYYLTEEYAARVLGHCRASRGEYYIDMAIAWLISVAYVKFPEQTEELLRENELDVFTQNKAIQKIRESYRVGREDKDRLLMYRRSLTEKSKVSGSVRAGDLFTEKR